MKTFSSVDLYFFVKENKEELLGSRLETFYLNEDLFYSRIYVKGKGNLFLTISLGSYLYLSKEKSNAPIHPTSFISYLRKYLKNSFIDGVEQIDLERVLKLVISKKNEDKVTRYHLYVELFSGGNIILCDEDDIILNSLIKKTYKDRKVRSKEKYELPPRKEINALNVDKSILDKVIKNSDLNIVKFLALECGLGGKYAEEICLHEGINKNDDVTSSKVISLLEKLFSLKVNPCLVVDNEKIVDFFPFEPFSKNFEKKGSFNECLFFYYTQFEGKKDVKVDEFDKKVKKLKKRVEKQHEQKEMVLRDSDKFMEMGEKIYEHYPELDELLNGINKAAKEKGWDYVMEVIENNEKLKSLVDKLEYKKNKIIVNLN